MYGMAHFAQHNYVMSCTFTMDDDATFNTVRIKISTSHPLNSIPYTQNYLFLRQYSGKKKEKYDVKF